MVRFLLIGASVISTALAGYFAKRKLSRRRSERQPPELTLYPSGSRPRKRKSRGSPLHQGLNNGEHDPDALA